MDNAPFFTDLSSLSCPYCGASIQLITEPLDETQDYIEDCEVCCQPMRVLVSPDGEVQLLREDD